MTTPRLHQAVVFAGGLGTRLRPLTDRLPKPMVPINGTPFLEYLIRQLASQGIEEVLLLLGYRADQIEAYFGDGHAFGVRIRYLVTPVEFETGLRLKQALPWLESRFLMLYCDNYWPLQLERLWQHYLNQGTRAQITVYRNAEGYTRSNLRIDERGRVAVYDKTRQAADLLGVDIGYAILPIEVVHSLSDENLSFEAQAYPPLAAAGELGAYVSDHRYYGIGSLERLDATAAFLQAKKVVFLDRDGVLNAKAPRWEYITKWEDFQWLPGAKEAIGLLKRNAYQIYVISNQAGIARGVVSQARVDQIHAKMQDELKREQACQLDGFYICPHGWDDGCGCRKPKAGMLYQAQREWAIQLTEAFVIGDSEVDLLAGEQAGCRCFLVDEKHSLLEIVKQHLLEEDTHEKRTDYGHHGLRRLTSG